MTLHIILVKLLWYGFDRDFQGVCTFSFYVAPGKGLFRSVLFIFSRSKPLANQLIVRRHILATLPQERLYETFSERLNFESGLVVGALRKPLEALEK